MSALSKTFATKCTFSNSCQFFPVICRPIYFCITCNSYSWPGFKWIKDLNYIKTRLFIFPLTWLYTLPNCISLFEDTLSYNYKLYLLSIYKKKSFKKNYVLTESDWKYQKQNILNRTELNKIWIVSAREMWEPEKFTAKYLPFGNHHNNCNSF